MMPLPFCINAKYWLFWSSIVIYSSIITATSATNCICNAAFPTTEYNGNCYATIDGTDPNDKTEGPGKERYDANKYYTLPEGWKIADTGSDTIYVSHAHLWGSNVLLFGYPNQSGTKHETWASTALRASDSDNCRDCFVRSKSNQYQVGCCTLRILISKPAECAPTKVDCDDAVTDYNLLFIVDESESVTQTNYESSIDFIIKLIEYDINDIAKLAVLSYSSYNDVVYKFENKQNDNRESIISVLDVEKLDYAKGATQTLNALQNGLNQFKDNVNIGNTDNNLIILFTDGKPTIPVCTAENNDLLQEFNAYNIRIIIVGITSSFDKEQLNCIAKSGDIFKIADFTSEAFQSIESELKNILCPRPSCPQSISSGSAVPYINDNKFDYDQIRDGDNYYHRKFYENEDFEYMVSLLLAFCMGVISISCVGFIILFCSKMSISKGYVEPKFQDDIE